MSKRKQLLKEEQESWFTYPVTPSGAYRFIVVDDDPRRLEVGAGNWRIERHAVDTSGTPGYSLYEGSREIAFTLYRNVAKRWLTGASR